jgi:hypothetical protein
MDKPSHHLVPGRPSGRLQEQVDAERAQNGRTGVDINGGRVADDLGWRPVSAPRVSR